MVRVAAVGVGHWHSVYDAGYLKLLSEIPDTALVGIHDPSEQLARKRSEQIGTEAAVFADYRDMIQHVEPDFVIVLGRHSKMAEYAELLIDHGIPFLIEKPMGLGYEQVRNIVNRAEKLGSFVAVPFTFRYQPYVELMDSLLSTGRIGVLRQLNFRLMRPTQRRYSEWDCGWMLDAAESGGGALRNLGPHGLDLFLRFAGPGASVRSAVTSTQAPGDEVEDFASVHIQSAAGILGTVEVGNLYPMRVGRDTAFSIYGSKGAVLAGNDAVQVIDADGTEKHTMPPSGSTALAALEAVFSALRNGEAPPCGARECLEVVRLIDEAYVLAE